MSNSVSLLEPMMSDKTKVQRWRLFLGGDGIGEKKKGNSSIWYSRAERDIPATAKMSDDDFDINQIVE